MGGSRPRRGQRRWLSRASGLVRAVLPSRPVFCSWVPGAATVTWRRFKAPGRTPEARPSPVCGEIVLFVLQMDEATEERGGAELPPSRGPRRGSQVGDLRGPWLTHSRSPTR